MTHRFDLAPKLENLWFARVECLQELIGYRFHKPEILHEALTHSSYRHEYGLNVDNERLEFAGDAVLQLLVTRKLLEHFPGAAEGELTRRRARLVCEEALLCHEKRIGLFDFLRVGKGVEKQGIKFSDSLRSNAVEAVLGAVFTDGGLEEADRFYSRFLFSREDFESSEPLADPKSRLQEIFQKRGEPLPVYCLLEKTGQDDAPSFVVGVISMGKVIATGAGNSKKEAEVAAALSALVEI